MNDTTDGPFGTFASLTLLISFEFVDKQQRRTNQSQIQLQLPTEVPTFGVTFHTIYEVIKLHQGVVRLSPWISIDLQTDARIISL